MGHVTGTPAKTGCYVCEEASVARGLGGGGTDFLGPASPPWLVLAKGLCGLIQSELMGMEWNPGPLSQAGKLS